MVQVVVFPRGALELVVFCCADVNVLFYNNVSKINVVEVFTNG